MILIKKVYPLSSEKKHHVEETSILVEKEEKVEVPEVVTLYFQRADNVKKTITIRTTVSDLMERVVALAAKQLGIKSGRIGVSGGGTPINFVGKTVGEVLKEYNTVSFHISSADMLG